MGDWTYEAKDFLTPAPYEALYQFHGQPFVHETKLQELSVYAANQGFRGFKSMYKKYIESLKAQAGTVYVDNVTNFTGQPLELNAGDWDATDLGVYRRNGFADELACPHPIMPVERLINIDTGEEKLKLAFRKGTMWRRLNSGTGWGSSNPTSLTFDFAPKLLIIGWQETLDSGFFTSNLGDTSNNYYSIYTGALTTQFKQYRGFGDPDSSYAKKSSDGKTITWYSTHHANSQRNDKRRKYYYLAIG